MTRWNRYAALMVFAVITSAYAADISDESIKPLALRFALGHDLQRNRVITLSMSDAQGMTALLLIVSQVQPSGSGQ